MHRDDPSCGPSTSTATPPYPNDDQLNPPMINNPSNNNLTPINNGISPEIGMGGGRGGNQSSRLTSLDTGFEINRWQNRNFDSGVQTMVHSQTQSLMSIHPSEISVMSGMTDDVSRQDLTDAQRSRFERLSIRPSGEYETSGIPELVQLMRDDDEAVVYKAVYMMQNIAKMDAEKRRERIISGSYVVDALREVIEKRSNSPNIVRVALGALFHLCNHPDGVKQVIDLVGNEPTLLNHLIKHMRTLSFSSYKYAILSLHSILSDRSALGQAATAEARRCDALSPSVEALRPDQSEKLLPIIVDLIRVLCEKSTDQKTRFIEQGGVGRLLDILSRCNYENLLWRTTKLLVQIANFNPSSLMAYNAPFLLQSRLSHPSERLVLCVLECLRTISDISSPPDADTTPVMASILRLFGHSNPFVSLYCVQILSNMIANHRTNKEFLSSKGAVPTLMRVLYESTLWVRTEKDKEVSEEMQESLLCCLRHLCVRHDYAQQVCTQVVAENNGRLLLDRLVNMRPAVLRQTLLILVQAAPLDANIVSFRQTQLPRDDSFFTFVHQIVIILRVACHQLPAAQPGVILKVENVRVAELISATMTVLASLCRDRRLFDETVYHLLQHVNSTIVDRRVFLPLFVLEQPWIQDDTMIGPALSLLAATCVHPEIGPMLAGNNNFFYMLQNHSRRPEPAIAHPSMHLLTVLFNVPVAQPVPVTAERYDSTGGYNQYDSYGPSYPMTSSSSSHHIQHPSMTTSHHSSSTHSRPEPSPEVILNTKGMNNQNEEQEQQLGPWPEDLQPLDGSLGDPFAQVFCSPATPPSPSEPAVFDAYVSPEITPHPPIIAPMINPSISQQSHYPYPDPYQVQSSSHHY